jgi:hypothetical protein
MTGKLRKYKRLGFGAQPFVGHHFVRHGEGGPKPLLVSNGADNAPAK